MMMMMTGYNGIVVHHDDRSLYEQNIQYSSRRGNEQIAQRVYCCVVERMPFPNEFEEVSYPIIHQVSSITSLA